MHSSCMDHTTSTCKRVMVHVYECDSLRCDRWNAGVAARYVIDLEG